MTTVLDSMIQRSRPHTFKICLRLVTRIYGERVYMYTLYGKMIAIGVYNKTKSSDCQYGLGEGQG